MYARSYKIPSPPSLPLLTASYTILLRRSPLTEYPPESLIQPPHPHSATLSYGGAEREESWAVCGWARHVTLYLCHVLSALVRITLFERCPHGYPRRGWVWLFPYDVLARMMCVSSVSQMCRECVPDVSWVCPRCDKQVLVWCVNIYNTIIFP